LLNALRTLQPTVIYSYTSSLVLIAQEMIRRGDHSIKPKFIFTTGELLHPYDRKSIEAAFAMPPRDLYGIIEMGDVAWQCPELNGYHLNIDSFFVEVLNGNHDAEPGESGRLVITNLHSRAMPFIRYEVGDIVTAPRDAHCACGCTFPCIDIVQGREDDWLYAADGRRVSPMDITIARIRGVTQYRIIQKRYDYVVAEIVPGQDFNENTLTGVKEHVSEAMGDGVYVEVTRVDAIPRQSGKLKCFFCEIEKPIHE
jgi:phenylacetate-CoA ligase